MLQGCFLFRLMAALDELINKIDNPSLKLQMQQVVRKLLKQKKFGLVFEDHLPESTLLQGLEVRVGLTVTYKSEPLKERFYVTSIKNQVAECVLLDNTSSTYNIPVDDLVPFATFGEPIYPYLQIQDTISTAPDSPLWHSLIQADNYHALQLLAYLYPSKVDCIYIDPPYNTGARDWKYNNDYVDGNDAYRHSKWLSMMKKRLLLAKKLLNPNDSVLIITIDEKEYNHLGCLLEEVFPNHNIQMISSTIAQKGVARNNSFYRVNEFIYIIQIGKSKVTPLPLSSEWQLGKGDSAASKGIVWSQLRRSGTNDLRSDRENLFYPIFFNSDGTKILDIGTTLDPSLHPISRVEIEGDKLVLWPIKDSGIEGNWQLSPEQLKERLCKGYVKIGSYKDNNIPISYLKKGSINKIEDNEVELLGYNEVSGTVIVDNCNYTREFIPGSQWNIQNHDATYKGTQLLSKFIGTRFEYPKSLYAVHDVLRFFVANKPNALIVDFFAGSGTTLHAVNLLNAEDGGNRRCIMVTNNEVGEATEKELTSKGYKPGDEEWENTGIARYVNWPRTIASITGNDVTGQPIKGEYLTYLTTEKESNRRFHQVSFVKDFATLSLSEKKDLVTFLSKGAIAKSLITGNDKYIIDNDSDIAILLEDNAASDWIAELESQGSIRDFIICTGKKKLFNSLKQQITESLGTFKEQVSMTLPMSQGFKANAIFFKLGFLDKQAVQMGRQFAELLPVLWMKSGAYGVCPQISPESIPSMLILPQNKFAVLTNENEFGVFNDSLVSTQGIETVYIVTDSERGYREMAAQLKVKKSYQLYRDYLDNFTINTKGSI